MFSAHSLGFLGGSEVKNASANAGDTGSIPGLGKSPGGGNGNPFQYSCQENPLDREPWWVTVHGVTKEVGYNFTYLHTHTHTHQESLSIPEAILSPSQPSLLS